MNKPIKVIVDRQTWYRGNSSDHSYLLTIGGEYGDSERLCCVGFLCRAMHYSDSQLEDVQTIGAIEREGYCDPFPKTWAAEHDDELYETNAFFQLYKINDDPAITDEERELALIQQALPLGIEFEFVN